jgi:hypothetical protein
MSRLREYLVRAAGELGLRLETEHTITLASGARLEADAFFPDIGTPVGMAVVRSERVSPETMEEVLFRMGYPAAFVGEPTAAEEFDIDSYAAMFSDWGWCGNPEKRPAWMKERDAEASE